MKSKDKPGGLSVRAPKAEPKKEADLVERLKRQARIRRYRGKLRWEGDVDAMRN